MIQTHSHPTEKHFAHFCFVRKKILSNNGDAMNSPPTTHQNEQTLFVHLQDTPSSARCCDLDMGNTIIRLRLEAIIRGPPCSSNTMRGPELKRKKKQKTTEKNARHATLWCACKGENHIMTFCLYCSSFIKQFKSLCVDGTAKLCCALSDLFISDGS